ncbi:MAG: SCP2 sterol-binding domain-containing protein [Myxococcota bacterium]|nr:SCP2 sterol-binding domain-containing protein [Myxococcota bacterium]MDW8362682.1 SCP2 sterol-binding domain-containing protein [Myxococcales bacterium]
MSDIRDSFEKDIQGRIAANPDAARTVGAIYLFRITGDDGGTWTVNLKDDVGVKAGDQGNAECTLEMAAEDWRTIRTTPSAAMQLYFQGKLRVSGNVMLATKLQQILNPS